MHFTHYTVDTVSSSCGVTGSTLQIYSFKILELKNGLEWPLKLYGEVAARDTVDRNRNILFSQSRRNYQNLSENGSLCLTGPTRAIVALDSDFEVELEIVMEEESQGKELITLSMRYDGKGNSLMFENSLCKAELNLEQLPEAVQATIVGVSVVEGEWPFENGCRVACNVAGALHEVVLKEVRGEKVQEGSNGYLPLVRNVVSVKSQRTLEVVIKSYDECGVVCTVWNFSFPAKQCQISESECSVDSLKGKLKVKVVVAWSLLVKEKRDLLLDYPVVEA
uniref:Uncharacterized protein n=1 Tax=Avena sativa TaxID=4498 RepID=A0ACD5VQR3_AVESA